MSAGDGTDLVVGGLGVDEMRGRLGDDTLDAVDAAAGDLVRGQLGFDTCTSDPGDTVNGCEA